MARQKIAVIGWYNHGNVGDEAFKKAFQALFPQFDFDFQAHVPGNVNDVYDAVWVGAGSFLDEQVGGLEDVKLPTAFLGIGMGHAPGDRLLSVMAKAKALVVRDQLTFKNLISVGLSPEVAPDLAFANPVLANPTPPEGKKAVVLLNDFFCPKMGGTSWQKSAWDWFLHEFARTCEGLIYDGYELDFVPMCIGGIDDRRPAGMVQGYLPEQLFEKTKWMTTAPGTNVPHEQCVHNAIAEASLVITQRFHGMVYSAQMGKPFIAIAGHDKIKGLAGDLKWGGVVDYYGFSRTMFRGTRKIVAGTDTDGLLEYAAYAKGRWSALSATIAAKFGG